MEKIIITFDIEEKGKYLVVSDSATWKGLCTSATLYNGKKKKKVSSKTMEMNPGLNTIEMELTDSEHIGYGSSKGLFGGTIITSCILPEGTKYLGSEVFYGCTRLKTLTLPSTLEEIGRECFAGCNSLEKVFVPASVKKAYGAFKGFDPTKIEFAPGIKKLPEHVFTEIDSDCELVIPEGVTEVGSVDENDHNAPIAQTHVKGIQFPKSIKTVTDNTFYETSLGHFEWPEGVPVKDQQLTVTGNGFCNMGYFALPGEPDTIVLNPEYDCDTIVIPAYVKNIIIKDNSYSAAAPLVRNIYVDPANKIYDSRENCNAIIETATGRMIFAGALTTVPEGVTEIAETAYGIVRTKVCPKLPSTLKSIRCSFSGFKEITVTKIFLGAIGKLREFYGRLIVAPEITEFPDCVYNGDDNNAQYRGKIFDNCTFTTLELPEGLEKIGDYTFQNCKVPDNLILPSTLKTIGKYAFANSGTKYDRYLEKVEETSSIIIPDSVTEIGESAFADWFPDKVTLPQHLEVLNDLFVPSRMRGAKHRTMVIPASVKKITFEGQWFCSFYDVDSFTCLATTAPEIAIPADSFNKNDPISLLSEGRIFRPKGADYSSWEKFFKGWKFRDIED